MDDLHLAEESGLPRAVRASELSRMIFSKTFWRRGGWRLSWCPTRGKTHQGGGGRTLQPMFVLGFDLVWRVSYCTWKRRYLYKWYTYLHACATILFIWLSRSTYSVQLRMILPCTGPATVESHFEKIANDSKTACQIARQASDEQGVFKCSLWRSWDF